MTEITAICACGQRMVQDACRGKGALRCPRHGCANRVRVAATADTSRRCAVPECRSASVTQHGPVTICGRHFDVLVLAMLPVVLGKYPPETWLAAQEDYEAQIGPLPDLPAQPRGWPLRAKPDNSHDPIVYFMVVGEQVKIGTTVNVHQRFRTNFPPSAQLALRLPGSAELESRLHQMFRKDRLEGEWFTLSDQIREFIADRTASVSG